MDPERRLIFMMQKDSLDWLALYKKKNYCALFDFCKKQQMEVKIGFFFFFGRFEQQSMLVQSLNAFACSVQHRFSSL